MADSTYEIVHQVYATEAAAILINSKNLALAQDTRRLVLMDGATPRYFWDSTRLADQTATYGTAIIGTPGITGVTPSGGSSGVAATLQAMLTGLAGTGNANFIQNGTGQQASSNFNISAAGVIGTSLAVGSTLSVSGTVGIVGAPIANASLLIQPAALTTSAQYGVYIDPTFTTAATSQGNGIRVGIKTASNTTMTNAYNINIAAAAFGGGSSITNHYGIWISNISGATNNYSIWTQSGFVHHADSTDSTSISTGSLVVEGGFGLAKNLWVGGTLNIASTTTLQNTLTVSGLATFAKTISIQDNLAPSARSSLELFYTAGDAPAGYNTNIGVIQAYNRDASALRGLYINSLNWSITDAGTFTGIISNWSGNVTSTASGGGGSAFYASAAAPSYGWNETDQASNGKLWDALVQSGVFTIRTLNDAGDTAANALAITRSLNTVTDVSIGNATNNNTFNVLGSGLSTLGGSLAVNGNYIKLPNLGSAPSSPAKGWMFFNTGSNHGNLYNGTSWVEFG